MIYVTRTSPFSGKKVTRRINASTSQLADWEAGKLAQVDFPQLSASDREFIMTGIADDEWDALFAENPAIVKGQLP